MTAPYREIMRVSPAMASRKMVTSGSGDGGVASPPIPLLQPVATSGSDAAAASTTRRVASRATWPPAVPPVDIPPVPPATVACCVVADPCGHLSMPWAADHRRPSLHDGTEAKTITACRRPARGGATWLHGPDTLERGRQRYRSWTRRP